MQMQSGHTCTQSLLHSIERKVRRNRSQAPGARSPHLCQQLVHLKQGAWQLRDNTGEVRHGAGIEIALPQLTLGVAFVQPVQPRHLVLDGITDDIGLLDLVEGGVRIVDAQQGDSARRPLVVDEDAIKELRHGQQRVVVGIGGQVEDPAAGHLHLAVGARVHSGRDTGAGNIATRGLLQIGPSSAVEGLPLRRHVHIVEAAPLLAGIDQVRLGRQVSAGQEQPGLDVDEAGVRHLLLVSVRVNPAYVKAGEVAGGTEFQALHVPLEVHTGGRQLVAGVVCAQEIRVVAQLHGRHKSAVSGVVAHAIPVRGGVPLLLRGDIPATPVEPLHGVGNGLAAGEIAEFHFRPPRPREAGVLHTLHPQRAQVRVQGGKGMAAMQLDAGAAGNLQLALGVGEPIEIRAGTEVQGLHLVGPGQILLHVHPAGGTCNWHLVFNGILSGVNKIN